MHHTLLFSWTPPGDCTIRSVPPGIEPTPLRGHDLTEIAPPRGHDLTKPRGFRYTTPAFLPPPKRFSDEEEENQASFSLHASSSSDLQRRSSFAHAHQPSSSAPAFAAAPHDHELAVYSKLVADVSVSGSDFVRVPSALVSEVGVSDRMSSLASSGGYHVSDHATRRAPGWHVSHDVTKLASEDEASDDSTKVASGSHVTSTHDTSNLASEASGTLGSEHSATAGEGGDTFKRLV